MKKIFLLISLISLNAFAVEKNASYKFTFTEDTGPARELSIHMTPAQDDKPMQAAIKATLASGKVLDGELDCLQLQDDEIKCTRDDGGGEFTLAKKIIQGKEEYHLRLTHLDLNEEGSKAEISIHSSGKASNVDVIGEKLETK